jgi:hypothetical protein
MTRDPLDVRVALDRLVDVLDSQGKLDARLHVSHEQFATIRAATVAGVGGPRYRGHLLVVAPRRAAP